MDMKSKSPINEAKPTQLPKSGIISRENFSHFSTKQNKHFHQSLMKSNGLKIGTAHQQTNQNLF